MNSIVSQGMGMEEPLLITLISWPSYKSNCSIRTGLYLYTPTFIASSVVYFQSRKC